jgi:hypothetical protein
MSAAEEMLQENATTVDRTLLRGFEAQSNKVSAQVFHHTADSQKGT